MSAHDGRVAALIDRLMDGLELDAQPLPLMRGEHLPLLEWVPIPLTEVSGEPQLVIDGFGPVTFTLMIANPFEAGLLDMDDFDVPNAWLVTVQFELGGAIVGGAIALVVDLGDGEAMLSVAEGNAFLGQWASRLCAPCGTLHDEVRAAWRGVGSELPGRAVMVKCVWVAPAFESPAMLTFVMNTMEWLGKIMDKNGDWALTVEAPSLEQVARIGDLYWGAPWEQAGLSLEWCRTTLVGLGCAKARPVIHGFLDGNRDVCCAHPDMFLWPK